MAPYLLGMVGHGEEAFGFLTGDMSEGFEITVGFFNGKARYVAFKKRTGTPWGEGDLRAALMQIGNTLTGPSNPPRNSSIMSRNGKREWSARLLAGKCRGAATPLSTCPTYREKLGLCQTRARSIRNFRFRDLPITDPPPGFSCNW